MVAVSILYLFYLGLLIVVVYLVVSALGRIARAAEDLAQTLRRMEANASRPSGGGPPLT